MFIRTLVGSASKRFTYKGFFRPQPLNLNKHMERNVVSVDVHAFSCLR